MHTNQRRKCEYVQEKDASELIAKAAELMEHQMTRNDFERHYEILCEYFELSQNGFLLKDLFNVMRVAEKLADRQDEVETYGKMMEILLSIAAFAPLLSKSSEIFKLVKDLEEYFSILGYLMVCLKSIELKKCTANALISLITYDKYSPRIAPFDMRNKAAENSRLPGILGQLLLFADDETFLHVLDIIRLVKCQGKFYEDIIAQDALNVLLMRIEPTWRERIENGTKPGVPCSKEVELPLYNPISSVLWVLLKYCESHREVLSMIEELRPFSIWSLQYAFILFVTSYNKFVERNDVLAIILQLLRLFPNLCFVESGLADDLANIGYISLFQPRSAWGKKIKITNSEVDFMYVKLLLTILPYYVEWDAGVKVLECTNIIYHLLKMLKNASLERTDSKWLPLQSCSINVFVWEILFRVIPKLEEEFIEHSGPSILLSCLQIYKDKELILNKCLMLFYNILKDDFKMTIRNSLLFNDGIHKVIIVAKSILERPVFSRLIQDCIQNIFCILKYLYGDNVDKNCTCYLEIVLKYMDRMLNPKEDEPAYDNRIIVCLMDFIWETVMRSDATSRQFMKRGGVYKMLDIVERYPFHVKLITLGALVDMCEDSSCVPYVITWKGRKHSNFLSLLLEIFRLENKMLGVHTGHRGQIADEKHPIMGADQRDHTNTLGSSSPAMYDLFLSCRPKVYAILQLIYERHAEVTEQADECYKNLQVDLSAEDKMTLLLAENFLGLKLCEAWREVDMELQEMNFKASSFDHKILNNLIERSNRWGKHLKKVQLQLLQEERDNGALEEKKLYQTLAEPRLHEALDALCELKYIARCTERMFRVSQKFLQTLQVKHSMRKLFSGKDTHTTFLSELHATVSTQKNRTLHTWVQE
ncbi:unnamed protein product [Acanthoscelides obtectus]|uniref:Cilia- and flagella-associated protein 69 ARM repeats domain-containing protein n=1 Tax=Acanthoscelides obtectus TaxID=200917 RepID=A0A9P0JVQ6_ACAOB|nr:unnamed protein product [Acanthoscelides obtectus]CAK1637387.1 Cilia- and flagella-associated protein 69 [Acanthoscelides obtectus]